MPKDKAEQGIGRHGSKMSADMYAKAEITTAFLKSLAHPMRLAVLCLLVESPLSVGEIGSLLNLPQAEVSKHLARLRKADLVTARRDGRTITYSLKDDRTGRIIRQLHCEFCA